MIEIVNPEPDPSLKQEIIYKYCGIKLSYLPIDIKEEAMYSMCEFDGIRRYIICPKCESGLSIKSS